MNDFVIQCDSLCKRFGSSEVLRGVDLSLPQGAIVGLLGNNGSGKSTLIKCLLGLLRISSGSASVFGEDPWNLSAASKARLGYVPQVVKLYPWMTVQQVIHYTAAFYESWNHRWCESLMRMWQVEGHKRVHMLSTGQLQRLALVLALGHRPDLLVLDEPAASLDPEGRRSLLRSLLEMSDDRGHTVLFSTHITSDLERIASHVAILSEGRISFFGELDELKDRVKRIRIHALRPLPLDMTVPSAIHLQVDGQTAVATVPGCDEQLVQSLESQFAASVSVEDLNLEDIFLELHHG